MSERYDSIVPDPGAETAYLFRHALLRDAAYDLHTLGDRARLHLLAAELLEGAFGGRPPDPLPLELMRQDLQAHATDPVAFEIAMHLMRAQSGMGEDEKLHTTLRLYLQRAAEYAVVQYQLDTALVAWQALEPLLAGVQRECCRYEVASALWRRGDLFQAITVGQEVALAMSRLSEPRLHAIALLGLGVTSRRSAPTEQVRQTLVNALALFRQVSDRHGVRTTLHALADVYEQTGERGQAVKVLQELVDSCRQDGDASLEALAHVSLSAWQKRTGDTAAAVKSLRHAIRQLQNCGARNSEANAWAALCLALIETGETDGAQEALKAARSIALACGDRRLEAQLLTLDSRLLRVHGRAQDAAEVLHGAVSALRECGDYAGEASALSSLGTCYFDLKAYEKARTAFMESRRVNVRLGVQSGLASGAGNLAIVEHHLGQLSAAADLFEACLSHYIVHPDNRLHGYFQCRRSLLRLEMGNLEGARSDWKQGLQLLKSVNAGPLMTQMDVAMKEACARLGVAVLVEASS